MYDFILGPFIGGALGVFGLGLLFQVIRFFTLTREKDPVFFPHGVPPQNPAKKRPLQRIVEWLYSLRKTVWCTHPLVMVMTSVFHFFLIVTPFLVLGHNVLLDQSLGFSFPSLPEVATDVLTIIVFLCAAFFLYRRLFVARVRAITTGYDYVILLITVAPFLTGYLAYHQWFDYHTVVFLHILSGEVMLITIPFTKLAHMIFFFLYRFLIGSEYSFSQGTRTW